MASIIRNKKSVFIISLTALLITLLFLFANLSLSNVLLSALLILLLGLSLIDARLSFLSILFLRPVLDLSVHNVILSFGDLQINVLSLLGMLMIILAISFIFFGKFDWHNFKWLYSFYTWIIFLLLGIVSIFNSFYFSESLKEILRFLSIFAAFFLGVGLLPSAKNLTWLIKTIIFSALPPALLALFQFINKTGLPENGIYRVFGSMTHPNMLAFYLLLSITLAVFLILNLKRTKLEVYLYSLLSLFYIFILFLTYTRGAYLALIMIFVIVGVSKFKKFLLVAFLAMIFVYALIPPLQTRFNSIFQSDPYGSVSWRFNLWRDGLEYFQERPWTGYGVGTAEKIISVKRDFRLGSPDPHNDYLRVALDGGYPLLASYLVLLVSFFGAVILSYWRESRPRLKNFFIFFLAFGVAVFIMSSGDNILNDTALQWQMWALAGSALACARLKPDLSA
ncbi:MAG: O-antigen ligase family protein [Patescibacteria group bacterium]|nr:O-antigen ligase family protein [Patescibacteria group bacterium]